MRIFYISLALMILKNFGRSNPQETLRLLAIIAGGLILFSLLVAYNRMSAGYSENPDPPRAPLELSLWFAVLLGLLTILNIVTFIQFAVF